MSLISNIITVVVLELIVNGLSIKICIELSVTRWQYDVCTADNGQSASGVNKMWKQKLSRRQRSEAEGFWIWV